MAIPIAVAPQPYSKLEPWPLRKLNGELEPNAVRPQTHRNPGLSSAQAIRPGVRAERAGPALAVTEADSTAAEGNRAAPDVFG